MSWTRDFRSSRRLRSLGKTSCWAICNGRNSILLLLLIALGVLVQPSNAFLTRPIPQCQICSAGSRASTIRILTLDFLPEGKTCGDLCDSVKNQYNDDSCCPGDSTSSSPSNNNEYFHSRTLLRYMDMRNLTQSTLYRMSPYKERELTFRAVQFDERTRTVTFMYTLLFFLIIPLTLICPYLFYMSHRACQWK